MPRPDPHDELLAIAKQATAIEGEMERAREARDAVLLAKLQESLAELKERARAVADEARARGDAT